MLRYLSPASFVGALLAFALSATMHGQTAPQPPPAPSATATPTDADVVKMDKFIANADADGLGPDTPTKSVFGFDKTQNETPRAITVVSDQQLQQMNILKSEDLVKAVPATYTNFRFGLQGTVSIRNQSSDFYFNGMHRIDPQGDFESVWGAYDSLEVVEGPSSPIFGLGRIGGYVNFIPKSARASGNSYISTDQTSVSIQYGSFNTLIAKFDYQTPVKVLGKPGGLSFFFEDKNQDGYKANGFSRQKLFQGGYSVNLTENLRMQVGFSYQLSTGGLPGGDNRTTYDTIATQSYWSGNFSYHIDENGDGRIDAKEARDSYFRGTSQFNITLPSQPSYTAPANYSQFTSAGAQGVVLTGGVPSANSPGIFRPSLYISVGLNDPFDRTIPWQGGSVPVGQGTWTQDGGLTQHSGNITMAQYLAGYLDTSPTMVGGQPVQRTGFQMMFYPTTSDNFALSVPGAKSGNVPYKGIKYVYWMPPAFDLNPTSFKREKWNKRQSIGEDYYQAQIGAYYLDFINDSNPDYTYKNQIFVDGNNQTKSGSNAYSQTQHPVTFEDKLSASRKFQPFSWWKVQALGSANFWEAWTSHIQNTGMSDIDFRRDLQINQDGNSTENTFTSNDRWYGMTQSSSYVNGLPVGADQECNTKVLGAALLFDQTFFDKLDLTIGGRYDYVDATAYIPAGVYDLGSTASESVAYLGPQNVGSGPAAGPSTYIGGTGAFIPFSQLARGNSSGPSWTTSLTYALPYDIHPYITYGSQSVLLNNTGSLDWGPQTVKNSLLGKSELFEVGVKGTLGKRVNWSFAYYNQYRASFSPITTTAGGASNTFSRGEEAKITWNVIKPLTVSVAGNWSLQHYEQGASITEPASAFGVPNVVDPATGAILIPADAFAWGGRINTTIPDSESRYRRAPGIPAAVITSTANYELGGGYFVGTTFFYQSAMALDRLDTLWVPKGHTFDGVVGYRGRKWELMVNMTNIGNSNIYNFAGFAYWVDPKFQRAVNVTATHHF